MNRRHFIKASAMAGTGALLLRSRAWSAAQSPNNIRKFVTALPGLGPSAANEIGQYIPLATKHTVNFAGKATDIYNLAVTKFSQRMHPDLPGRTDFFGYTDLFTLDRKYLAGVIVAKRGTPVLLSVTNLLPPNHILPVDPTVMAGPAVVGGPCLTVGDLPQNRICNHLHGGLTPWFSDGTPFQWFTPLGKHGPSFMNVPGTLSIPGTGTYYYPNDQSARLVWYHDHAIGLTRLNAYAGIASAYVIIDDFEIGLVNDGLLPDLVGIPLVLQDKGFVSENILDQDPTWEWGGPGSLWYPHEYDTAMFADGSLEDPPAMGTMPFPPVSAVPEAFLDTILVNGGVYPVATVPPKRVRFRMLNGSQARFFHLNLYPELSNSGEPNLAAPGPAMYQVASEGGFLPAVAVLPNGTPCPRDPADPAAAIPTGPFNLLLAPAERADVVIDFNGVPPGSTFILYSDAPAPFPGGDPSVDYFTGNPDQPASGGPGFGPNTRTLMKIVVAAGACDSLSTPAWLAALNPKLKAAYLNGTQPGLLFHKVGDPSVPKFPFNGTPRRRLTLNEDFDEFGRLTQTLGTFKQNGLNNQGLATWARGYLEPSTENPTAGAVEVWQIFNLSEDVHPIHFHLVNVQLIQRQPFTGKPGREGVDWSYTGPPTRPDANEKGWKETVRMNGGEVTTVIMKFDLPQLPTAAMRNAVSPRTGGKEYVWHCHILEHEEHDMMRPLIVK